MSRTPEFIDRQLRRPFVDFALCLLFKRRRLSLPLVDPAKLWPAFEAAEVTIGVLPKGDWATPTNDYITLMKLASVLAPMRILELGSYRGHTTKGLLEQAPDAVATAVDIDPQHGEAYRDTPLAARVDRRVGAIGLDLFTSEEMGSFDLVFIDADHRRAPAEHDTQVALEMVSSTGTVLWHDYGNWGWFTGACGVPEVLNELATELPVAHVLGSNIAIHRPTWSTDSLELDVAVEATNEELRRGHWESDTARRFSF